MSEKSRKISLIIFIIIIGLMLVFFAIFGYNLAPVNSKDDKTILFEIKEGTGRSVIAHNLEKNNLIKSSFFLKIYMYFDNSNILAGTYKLSPNMSSLEIIEVLESNNSLENETITITFIEGKTLKTYVNQIVENFNFTEEDVYNKLSDTDFLNSLIDKYWFITSDILNDNIYYPLEGYIYPDTYTFKKVSTIEEIITKTLDNMNNKLSEYKEEIELSSLSIHQLLTLASIVELEGTNSNDRASVAGVFYNRLNSNWTLGSDVTTYYAVKKDFSSSLTQSDLNSCNGYNTRGTCVKGLPVGPICSASLSSITATINPTEHDYYYFVADINKETYFSKTGSEHNKIVATLKEQGKWNEY